MRVGFDLDGVLYNFGDSVKRYLDFIGQGDVWKSGPTKDAFWNFYEDWGWDSKKFVQLCNDGADAGFIFTGPAREGAPEAVQAIREMGHSIHIITDRSFGSSPSVSHANTSTWLREHGMEYESLTFTRDKTIVKVDVMIEDKLENYDALEADGTLTYLINRQWNNVRDRDFRRRITTLDEYVNAVRDLSRIRELQGQH